MSKHTHTQLSLSGDHPDRSGAGCAPPGTQVRRLYPDDVVYFVQADTHAHLTAADQPPADNTTTPDYYHIRWLDGYTPGSKTRRISRDALETLAQQGLVTLIETDVSQPAERWGLTWTPRTTPPTHPQRSVPIDPRYPVDQLRFTRTFDQALVNGVLENPVVDHKLGGVTFQRAMFVALTPNDRPCAVAVLNVPNARMLDEQSTIELVRYASHPDTTTESQTNNTASWMLSKVCRWAKLEGFQRVRSLAGVDANEGAIYKAANFKHTGHAASDPQQVAARGDGRTPWTNADTLDIWVRDLHDDPTEHPRRAEARVDVAHARSTQQTRLSDSSTYDPSAATPTAFTLTREALRDSKFQSPDYPAFSPRVRKLFAHESNIDASFDALAAEHPGETPPAVFGATYDSHLVAALVVTGDPRRSPGTATVAGYAGRETAWPTNTARWLLSRVRDWSRLNGFSRIRLAPDVFETNSTTDSNVGPPVGFHRPAADGGIDCDPEPYRIALQNPETPSEQQ